MNAIFFYFCFCLSFNLWHKLSEISTCLRLKMFPNCEVCPSSSKWPSVRPCTYLCLGKKNLLLVYVIVLLLAARTAVCPGRFWHMTVAVQGQSQCHIVLTQRTPAVTRSQPRRPARECANCTVVVRERQAVDFASEMVGSVGFSVWLQPMIIGIYKCAHLCSVPKWENINFPKCELFCWATNSCLSQRDAENKVWWKKCI